MRWYADENEHDDRLREGVALAAAQGATVVCLPELTRSPYFCTTDDPMAHGAARHLEDVEDGPTVRLAADLDLDQRRDWLQFGLLQTRRPELYGRLTEPLHP
ncbi:hypothetical protein OG756_30955 [Streptomyces sp. NBC_01310]|uniref:hypothetical protein n=1 Tax=Streptomyces sp. NBC_01310 TaxID=2903820 RepID=UPI0035B66C68|nr:hypothetical protein OG756_30955 [Streptomyces sp. NBC_01310]